MSVGPLGGALGSAAGVPLSQTKGSEAERAAHDTADSQRRIKNAQKAEAAAGIAEADGEGHDTNERDADGRRLFEAPPEARDEEAATADDSAAESRKSRDASGQSGGSLDLTG